MTSIKERIAIAKAAGKRAAVAHALDRALEIIAQCVPAEGATRQAIWLQPGDSRELLKLIPTDSLDSLVTDPPYLLGFMGKQWDKLDGNPAQDPAFWSEVYRVLKPGAYGVAFGAPRTFHRLAVAMEDAGFEIRDSLHWIFGQGFPKSMDISKALDKSAGAEREVIGKSARHVSGKPNQRTEGLAGGSAFRESIGMGSTVTTPATDAAKQWTGFGTALKPAHEPILLVRKPPRGTVAANVQAFGVGGINVDGCRIGNEERPHWTGEGARQGVAYGALGRATVTNTGDSSQGRWPANVALTHAPTCGETCAPGCPVPLLDMAEGGASGVAVQRNGGGGQIFGSERRGEALPDAGYRDSGGVSRYFLAARYGVQDELGSYYHPKAGKRERNAGVRGRKSAAEQTGRKADSAGAKHARAGANHGGSANYHPTVKPVELMRWLARLVTPPGGVCLEPFLGSGTTALAARLEGLGCVGFDLDPDHVRIALERIAHRFESTADPQADPRQPSLFGDL